MFNNPNSFLYEVNAKYLIFVFVFRLLNTVGAFVQLRVHWIAREMIPQ